jgi:hypothetical protein
MREAIFSCRRLSPLAVSRSFMRQGCPKPRGDRGEDWPAAWRRDKIAPEQRASRVCAAMKHNGSFRQTG